MRKRLCASAVAICCLTYSLGALADAEYVENCVTVTEQVQSQKNQRFTLRVYRQGAAESSEEASDIIYLAEQTVNENGKVIFDFTLNSASGLYPYVIRSETGEEEIHGIVNFVNEGRYKSILEQLVQAAALPKPQNSEAVRAVIEENMQELLLTTDFLIYDKIKTLDTTSAYSRMAGLINQDTASEELRRIFAQSMALCGVSKGSAPLVCELADGYKAFLGCDNTEINALYDALDYTKRLEAAELIACGSYSEPEQFSAAFSTSTVFTCMNNAESWQELGEIINKYADTAGLNITNYRSLTGSKPNSALQKLVTKRPFTSVEDFNSKLVSAIEAVNSTNTPPSGSTGSTSSGTSGKGISATVSPDVLNSINSTQNKEIFTDLDTVEWAREAIEELAKLEVVSGRGDGIFDPQSPVTREEFVKILILAIGMKPLQGELRFLDADPDAWYYDYVTAAVENGITVGFSDTHFGIGTPISRQDAAVMIVRAVNNNGIQLTAAKEVGFSDTEQIADYAIDAVSTLAAYGVINGMGDGTFAPDKAITRAEAARIVYGIRGIDR